MRLLILVVQFCFLIDAVIALGAMQTFHYDDNGNLIRGQGLYFEYNDANKLVRVRKDASDGEVIAEYWYDYKGQRIKKVENGITTYYIGKHYQERRSQAVNEKTNFYFVSGQRVAKKVQLNNEPAKLSFFLNNHLGSTDLVTDSDGSVVDEMEYFPYGGAKNFGAERYNYTGKEKDKVTGLHYYEARYYNSDIRHFTQADTITPNVYDPQSLNRYSYVKDNPINKIDPTGHISINKDAVWYKPWTWIKSGQQDTPSSNSKISYENAENTNTETTNIQTRNQYIGLPLRETKVVTDFDNEKYAGERHIFPEYSEKNPALDWCTEYVAKHFNVTWGGNGGSWLENAKNQGYSTGRTPYKDSIIVMSGGDYGHVGIIRDFTLNDDGSFDKLLIEDSNWVGPGEQDLHWISNSNSDIEGFIYTENSHW